MNRRNFLKVLGGGSLALLSLPIVSKQIVDKELVIRTFKAGYSITPDDLDDSLYDNAVAFFEDKVDSGFIGSRDIISELPGPLEDATDKSYFRGEYFGAGEGDTYIDVKPIDPREGDLYVNTNESLDEIWKVVDGKWQHHRRFIDKSGETKLYVDGKRVEEGLDSNNIYNPSPEWSNSTVKRASEDLRLYLDGKITAKGMTDEEYDLWYAPAGFKRGLI